MSTLEQKNKIRKVWIVIALVALLAIPLVSAALSDSFTRVLIKIDGFFTGQQYKPYAKTIDFIFFTMFFMALYVQVIKYAFKENTKPVKFIAILLGIMSGFLLTAGGYSVQKLIPYIPWLIYFLLAAFFYRLLSAMEWPKSKGWRLFLSFLLAALLLWLLSQWLFPQGAQGVSFFDGVGRIEMPDLSAPGTGFGPPTSTGSGQGNANVPVQATSSSWFSDIPWWAWLLAIAAIWFAMKGLGRIRRRGTGQPDGGAQEQTHFIVKENAQGTAFLIEGFGSQNPTITLRKGGEYTFTLQLRLLKFNIKTQDRTAVFSTELAHQNASGTPPVVGDAAQNHQTGVLMWRIPPNAPDRLSYCNSIEQNNTPFGDIILHEGGAAPPAPPGGPQAPPGGSAPVAPPGGGSAAPPGGANGGSPQGPSDPAVPPSGQGSGIPQNGANPTQIIPLEEEMEGVIKMKKDLGRKIIELISKKERISEDFEGKYKAAVEDEAYIREEGRQERRNVDDEHKDMADLVQLEVQLEQDLLEFAKMEQKIMNGGRLTAWRGAILQKYASNPQNAALTQQLNTLFGKLNTTIQQNFELVKRHYLISKQEGSLESQLKNLTTIEELEKWIKGDQYKKWKEISALDVEGLRKLRDAEFALLGKGERAPVDSLRGKITLQIQLMNEILKIIGMLDKMKKEQPKEKSMEGEFIPKEESDTNASGKVSRVIDGVWERLEEVWKQVQQWELLSEAQRIALIHKWVPQLPENAQRKLADWNALPTDIKNDIVRRSINQWEQLMAWMEQNAQQEQPYQLFMLRNLLGVVYLLENKAPQDPLSMKRGQAIFESVKRGNQYLNIPSKKTGGTSLGFWRPNVPRLPNRSGKNVSRTKRRRQMND